MFIHLHEQLGRVWVVKSIQDRQHQRQSETVRVLGRDSCSGVSQEHAFQRLPRIHRPTFTYTVIEYHVTRVLWPRAKAVDIMFLIQYPVYIAFFSQQFEVAEILDTHNSIRGYPQLEDDAHSTAVIEDKTMEGIHVYR